MFRTLSRIRILQSGHYPTCWIAVTISSRISSSPSQNSWDINRSSLLTFTTHFLFPYRKNAAPITSPRVPLYLVNLIKQRRTILYLHRLTRSEEYRNSLHSLDKYIHYELRMVKRAQWQEFCLGLEPKNTQHFWNYSKKLSRKRATSIQAFLDERNNRVISEADTMIEHVSESETRSSQTPVETVRAQHPWSASVYSSTENENVERSWEGVEQTAQIDSSLTLRLHPPNIQRATDHLLASVNEFQKLKGIWILAKLQLFQWRNVKKWKNW